MKSYNNSYTREEDPLLWELHEIRHRLHAQRQHQTLEEINQQALYKYAMWQQEREERQKDWAPVEFDESQNFFKRMC